VPPNILRRMHPPNPSFQLRVLSWLSVTAVIDHTQDPGAVLREARRLTEPGGPLILAVNVYSIIGLYRRRYITAVLHPHRSDVVSHHRSFIPRQIDTLLTACGCRPQATSSVGVSSGLFGRVHRYRVPGEGLRKAVLVQGGQCLWYPTAVAPVTHQR
jgi:hypothetical protein